MIHDFSPILKCFTGEIENTDLSQIDLDDISIKLPRLQKNLIIEICNQSIEIFKHETTLLELKLSNAFIIGDLHGNVFDVFRIIKTIGFPSNKSNLVFLGDIIDRGAFSLETILVILLLKLVYPMNVFIIRGNHEFDLICSEGGFKNQMIKLYDLDTYNYFLNVFSYLPLAALINKQVFCVHGGLGPTFTDLDQIRQIQRPINDYINNEILISVLWSDPEETIEEYQESYRGSGFIFGSNAFHRFIQKNNIKLLIRGHECVDKGFQYLFGERLITVFSASKYGGCAHNSAGIIQLDDGLDPVAIELQPMEYIERDMITFYDYTRS